MSESITDVDDQHPALNYPKRALLAGIITSTALLGVFDQIFSATNSDVYQVIALALFATSLGFGFVWFVRDSAAAGYRRSMKLNIGFILLPIVFTAVYLYKSRSRSERRKAMLFFTVFLLILMFSHAVGMLLGDIAIGVWQW
jgi:hypothetical protein